MTLRHRVNLARSLAALVVLGAGAPASACMNEMVATAPSNPLVVLMVSATVLVIHYVSLGFLASPFGRIATLLVEAAVVASVAAAIGIPIHGVDAVALAAVLVMIVLAHLVVGKAKAEAALTSDAKAPPARPPQKRRIDGFANRPAE